LSGHEPTQRTRQGLWERNPPVLRTVWGSVFKERVLERSGRRLSLKDNDWLLYTLGSMHGRRYDPEFKRKLCRIMVAGERTLASLSREHGICQSALFRWKTEFKERGEKAFTPRSLEELEALPEFRIAQLERMVGKLSAQNALLKAQLQESRKRGRS
jgi:transposase